MGQSSTLFTVGTLLRHAQDAATPVRVLVQGSWLEGVIVGADGMGVIIDDRSGQQVLVRLDSVVAVGFNRSAIDGEPDEDAAEEPQAWAYEGKRRAPIEAGPVSAPTTPGPRRDEDLVSPARR